MRIKLNGWPGRADGSYESTNQPRWEPGEVRDVPAAEARQLKKDFPGVFVGVSGRRPKKAKV